MHLTKYKIRIIVLYTHDNIICMFTYSGSDGTASDAIEYFQINRETGEISVLSSLLDGQGKELY